MKNSDLIQRDLNVLWHPCTQMKDHEWLSMVAIKSGKGMWLEDFDGNQYLDAISSWWVNIFGHANPTINARIQQQLGQLEHVIFAGFTHEPAVELAERLLAMTPSDLSRCFYADNGSAAVEVALKMSFHYWLNVGQTKKTKFMTLSNSYHGETLGALAVGDVGLYKQTYDPLLLKPIVVESPDCYFRDTDQTWEDFSRQQFAHMEAALAKHADETCAVIVEPLVQCAGGMRMYHPIYLELLRDACNRYDVHLIADEIAVGFGRTGTMFAVEQANICPDFMCLSKGLTGGYLPLAAVLTTDTIFQAFYDDYNSLKAFLHSHSYTGNPLVCTAALATLDLFESENIIEKNKQTSQLMTSSIEDLHDHPHIGDIRQTGMILAMEMVQDKAKKIAYPWQERRGLRVYQHALKHSVLLRPLGNVVYFMPPYIINEEQINLLAEVAKQGIQKATQD